MSIAAAINPTVAARSNAVTYLNGLEIEEVEEAVAVINALLVAAGTAPVARTYTADVTVTLRKDFDDCVELDEDPIKEAIETSIRDGLDKITGDVEVEDVDTSVTVTGTVTTEVEIEVQFSPEGEDAEAAALAAVEDGGIPRDLQDQGWEADTDTASVADIRVAFA